MSVRRAAGGLVLCFVLVGEIGARAETLEPEGYRLDDYRAPTPETVHRRDESECSFRAQRPSAAAGGAR